MLTGCAGRTIVLTKMPQSPKEFMIVSENSMKPDVRVVNLGFEKVVERIKKVSKQCYQFNVTTKLNGGEISRDRLTSKVTLLSPARVVFTMQEKRTSGPKVVYTHNDEPDGGMWLYAIEVEKTSSKVSNAKLYYPVYFYKDTVNTVLDAVEGKYGDACPPKEDLN
jgi:hypothetical protein